MEPPRPGAAGWAVPLSHEVRQRFVTWLKDVSALLGGRALNQNGAEAVALLIGKHIAFGDGPRKIADLAAIGPQVGGERDRLLRVVNGDMQWDPTGMLERAALRAVDGQALTMLLLSVDYAEVPLPRKDRTGINVPLE